MNKLLGAAAAACVASGAALAQPELELFATTDAQVELVQQITELRAAGGPTPVGTIDPLRALAVLYQEAGNDALAIAVLEEARYVTRVHQGLSSADEALLLRQQIRSEKELGDHQRVWDLEQDMVTIARQHHDDIRMAPIFRELAEDRSEALEQYRAGHLPPEVYLGCYYVPGSRRYDDTRGDNRPPPHPDSGGCRSGSSSAVTDRFRWEILLYYADAIEVMVKNGEYASQELRDLEKEAFRISETYPGPLPVRANVGTAPSHGPPRVLRCSGASLDELLAPEILGSCLEPVIHGDGFVMANVGGGASLVRLIAYETRSGAPAADRANAIADLADWYLFSTPVARRRFANGDRALGLYEQAYRELRQNNEARARLFSPEVPVTFVQPRPKGPGFPPGPYTPAPDAFASTATAAARYIDVSFDVTKYGRGEQIEILETGKGATRAEERDAIRLIEGFNFRPRFVDGKLADAAPVVVRYHLSP